MKAIAVVLAGGQGKRMGPLCYDRPKPALPFAGGYRVIDFTLSNCVNSGINDIFALTDYKHDCMSDYLDDWRLVHLGDRGLHIRKPSAGHYSGTADAVYRNLRLLENSGADVVLVLAADHVYKMDYRPMLDFHARTHAGVTVGVAPVDIRRASHFGIVRVAADRRILDFVEKPLLPPGNLASMGIYVFNTELLISLLEADADDPASSHDFGYHIIPAAMSNDNAFAYTFDGYWQDIGTPEAYLETNLMLTHADPAFEIDGAWPLLTADRGAPAAGSDSGYGVINCIVGDGCIVEGRVENSVLSPGVCVAQGAVVRDSVLMRGVSIGKGALVERAILDEGVILGQFCNVGRTGGEVTVLERGTVVNYSGPLLHLPESDVAAIRYAHGDWRARVGAEDPGRSTRQAGVERLASHLTIERTRSAGSRMAMPAGPVDHFGPGTQDVLVQCPKCKAVETLQFVGDTLTPSRKYSQREGQVYHDCGSQQPCRVHGQSSRGR